MKAALKAIIDRVRSGPATSDYLLGQQDLADEIAEACLAEVQPSNGLPLHIDIHATGTTPSQVAEVLAEVRAGLLTVDGAIGARINNRIAGYDPLTDDPRRAHLPYTRPKKDWP